MNRGLLLVMLSLMLTGCAASTSPAAAPASSPTAVPAPGSVSESGIIVALEGQANVKRSDWREYAPALFGMIVSKGDLVRVEGRGRVTLACADLQLATVQGGPSGLPCAPSPEKMTFVYRGAVVNVTRGEAPELQTILPRKTQVLDPLPLLRWSAVPGVDTYHVSVQGTGWSADVGPQTELIYPSDAPALAAGKTYKLVVTAGNRTSEDETVPGLGFSILPDDQVELVRSAARKIRALELGDAPTRLLVANLYANNELVAEAIQQLEGLSGAQEPVVSRMLGDLYLQVGLGQMAERDYLRAFALSEKAGDIEGQALAQKALGVIYSRVMSNEGEAAKSWQRSLDLYEKLGAVQMIEQIKKESGRKVSSP